MTGAVTGRRRRRWALAAWMVLIAGAVALWATTGTDRGSAQTGSESNPPTTAEVTRTDLQQTTSYDGTLGRLSGDPVPSAASGTVTASAAPGATIGEGDRLFSIDGEPTVLLYGDTPAYRPMALSNQTVSLTSRATGTVTAVPAIGDVIESGDIVYEVDGHPTVLLEGTVPAWRELRSGMDAGPDVAQLEQALIDLGYDPDGTVTVDEDYTWLTREMVRRWQEDLGVETTGVVSPGDIAFLAGPVEVRAVAAPAGGEVTPGTPVLEVGDGSPMTGEDVHQLEEALARLGFAEGTAMKVDGTFDPGTRDAVLAWQEATGASVDGIVDLGEVVFASGSVHVTGRLVPPGTIVGEGTGVLAAAASEIVVSMGLPTGDQGNLVIGDPVVVTLPDRTQVPATVDSVADTATVADDGTAVFEVVIVLDDPETAAGLVEAPVTVDVVSDEVADVMAVPVTALLALAEGGYALEVLSADGTTLVAVDPGFYAGGMVEVTSEGLQVGDLVVIP